MRAAAAAMLALVALVAFSCGRSDDQDASRQGADTGTRATDARTSEAEKRPVEVEPPEVTPYTPLPGEEFPAAKQLAGRAVQQAMTYARGDSASEVAARVVAEGRGGVDVASGIAPLVESGRRSWGRIDYGQLSGETPTNAGVMVVARQISEDAEGRRREVRRVVDVRLRLVRGAWALERIVSLGGSPVARPKDLAAAARRVLGHRNIDLPDSAKWDIYRGGIDPALLQAIAQAADTYPMRVTVLDAGHPPNVWATSRASAHGSGKAIDIWSVSGRRVIDQRQVGSPAFQLAQRFVNTGAAQVGSPWVFGGGGRRSFTDKVHADHLHVQISS